MDSQPTDEGEGVFRITDATTVNDAGQYKVSVSKTIYTSYDSSNVDVL